MKLYVRFLLISTLSCLIFALHGSQPKQTIHSTQKEFIYRKLNEGTRIVEQSTIVVLGAFEDESHQNAHNIASIQYCYSYIHTGGNPYIFFLTVKPAWRGKNIATSLLQKALIDIKEHAPSKDVYLDAQTATKPQESDLTLEQLVAFYQRHKAEKIAFINSFPPYVSMKIPTDKIPKLS